MNFQIKVKNLGRWTTNSTNSKFLIPVKERATSTNLKGNSCPLFRPGLHRVRRPWVTLCQEAQARPGSATAGHRVSRRPAGQQQNACALGPQRFPHWTSSRRAHQSLRPRPTSWLQAARGCRLGWWWRGKGQWPRRGLVLGATSASRK
jgi:hypothetical protein